MEAVNGAATHQIIGGPQGIDERLYVDLRTRDLEPGLLQPAFAPIVEGYVTIDDRTMQLVGIDPLASPELGTGGRAGAEGGQRGRAGAADTHADGRAWVGLAEVSDAVGGAGEQSRVGALRKWFVERGSVVMAARTAEQLGIATGRPFDIDVGGVLHPAVLMNQIRDAGAAYDALLLTDIAQAQEWLGFVGRLSRIDVRVPAGHDGELLLARLRVRFAVGRAAP